MDLSHKDDVSRLERAQFCDKMEAITAMEAFAWHRAIFRGKVWASRRFSWAPPVSYTHLPTPTPAPTTSYSTLQSGSTGSSVMRLQESLIELGYLDDTADGNFGSNTEAAVRAAQADFGMAETLSLIHI